MVFDLWSNQRLDLIKQLAVTHSSHSCFRERNIFMCKKQRRYYCSDKPEGYLTDLINRTVESHWVSTSLVHGIDGFPCEIYQEFYYIILAPMLCFIIFLKTWSLAEGSHYLSDSGEQRRSYFVPHKDLWLFLTVTKGCFQN